ncbi:MAG: aminopeptidase P N-terminal domain-containing protein [Gemmatimonadota bacterium]
MEHSPAGIAADLRGTYRARRDRVFQLLGSEGALILAAAPEIVIGRDTELRYVRDAELLYLTGYAEPEAVAVFVPGKDEQPFTLFVRPRDPAREQWTGMRGGTEAAVAQFGAAAAYPIAELGERLPTLLTDIDVVYARLDATRPNVEGAIRRVLEHGRRSRARTGKGAHTLIDPGLLLDELRIIKDQHEITMLRQAARLSVDGFCRAAGLIKPGIGEWQIEAAIEAEFRAQGADGSAFPSIIASGANATVLHYISNDQVMQAGELLLIDAGARYRGYCGDISRTFPVNGRFSAAQRDLYDGVLRAHDAAVAAVRPGATIDQIHDAAQHQLIEVLRDLGAVEPNADPQASEPANCKTYIPHKTSHWLGLEVHDVGAYTFRSGPRSLEPGMVLTIEPGLYLPAAESKVSAELRGTGIRIEDDILVTPEGFEVLTAALPTRVAEIEALMGQS